MILFIKPCRLTTAKKARKNRAYHNRTITDYFLIILKISVLPLSKIAVTI